jgi:uncharacterized protein YjbJ (UPF0337 family)
MNRDTLKGQWTQFKGDVKIQWGKLTDDDLSQINGNVDKLIGAVQERYGYARERAESEVNQMVDRLITPQPTHTTR